MINRRLKQDLLKKLGITPQALSQRAERIKKEMPMTTEEATYVVAQQEGLPLDKYLDKNTLDKMRDILSQRKQGVVIKETKNNKAKNKNKEIIFSLPGFSSVTDPLLDSAIINQAKEMAAIYPLLYILENSIRKFICLIMEKEYGPDWWNQEASKKLKDKVHDRMNDEHINSWHQRRGHRPIDYLDLNELPGIIIRAVPKIAPGILPAYEWFTQLIDEVYKSRCVLCHMNPLDKTSISSIKVKFSQWEKQIKAKADKLNN
jgi:hypothetical protein